MRPHSPSALIHAAHKDDRPAFARCKFVQAVRKLADRQVLRTGEVAEGTREFAPPAHVDHDKAAR
jgi:hypothetical protein